MRNEEERRKWANMAGSDAARMAEFLRSGEDAYLILQIPDDPEYRYERFMPLGRLEKWGRKPDPEHYRAVYAGISEPYINRDWYLEILFRTFNLEYPEDFRARSMSTGDIVALKKNGAVSYHFVDSIGFKELPEFRLPEEYLKNAEMLLEDDYNMIDGIINNGESPAKEMENASVLERLRGSAGKKEAYPKREEPVQEGRTR